MEYPVLLGYSLVASRAGRWFRGSVKPRVLVARAFGRVVQSREVLDTISSW
jgi:hypothetical protein